MAMQDSAAGGSDFFGNEQSEGGDASRGEQVLNDLEAFTEKLRGSPTSTGSARRGAQILADLEALIESLRGESDAGEQQGANAAAPPQQQPPVGG